MTNFKASLLSLLSTVSLTSVGCAVSEDDNQEFGVAAVAAIAISGDETSLATIEASYFAEELDGTTLAYMANGTALATVDCAYNATDEATYCTPATPIAGVLPNVTIQNFCFKDTGTNAFAQAYVVHSGSGGQPVLWSSVSGATATPVISSLDCTSIQAEYDAFEATMTTLAAQLEAYDTRTNKLAATVAKFDAALDQAEANVAALAACPAYVLAADLDPAALRTAYPWATN